jgi:hypothetical protein
MSGNWKSVIEDPKGVAWPLVRGETAESIEPGSTPIRSTPIRSSVHDVSKFHTSRFMPIHALGGARESRISFEISWAFVESPMPASSLARILLNAVSAVEAGGDP